MTRHLSAIAVILASAMPVFADDMMDPAKMTCADFEKMDQDGMMKAIDMMHKAGPDMDKAMDDAAMKMAGEHTMKACMGKPDMMAMDAMMSKM